MGRDWHETIRRKPKREQTKKKKSLLIVRSEPALSYMSHDVWSTGADTTGYQAVCLHGGHIVMLIITSTPSICSVTVARGQVYI